MKKRFWLTCDDDGCDTVYYGVSSEPAMIDQDGYFDCEPYVTADASEAMFGITLERGEQVQLEITVRELPLEDGA